MIPFRALLALLFLAAPALADDMTFFIRNQQDRAVVIEFRAQAGDRVWPGGGDIYLLDAGERKSVTIDCAAGENICYGAWIAGDDSQSFGVGPIGDRACADCCAVCADKTTTTVDLARQSRPAE